MKRIGKPWFFVVALLIIALAYGTFFGVYGNYGDITTTYIRGAKDIRWGTDIQGGVSVTFGPSGGYDASDSEMEGATTILENRLVANNITDYELYVDKSSDRIMIDFPWKDGESHDVESTIDELSATAVLLFVEGQPSSIASISDDRTYVLDEYGRQYKIVIEGKHVDSANVTFADGKRSVQLNLTDDGAVIFSTGTANNIGKVISIWMDDTMISAPVVNQAITDGVAIISNTQSASGFEAEEAQSLSNNINGGALPFSLETKDYDVVDPTLGKDSLQVMLIAGIIAFIIVCAFMLIYYRLPGFVACIALLGQAAGSIAAVSGFFAAFPSFTLTLPGIAGIILSIGMGVDANIITNERIKEEVLKGKTLDGAIDSGNENSFSSIFDGNVTVIIVAVILMGVFGPPDTVWSWLLTPFLWMFPAATTGAIYSFGYTLLVGVILNFVMGVTASRIMLKSLSRFKIFRKRWLYGGVDEK